MMFATLSPPALIYVRKSGSPNRWGKAQGPVVLLPHGYPAHLKAHELHHVKQWWFVTVIAAIMLLGLQVIVPQVPLGVVGLSVGVMGALQYTSAWFRLRVEVAGYGASYKVDPENITKFATALSNSYKLGVSVNECKRLIKSHAGRLF